VINNIKGNVYDAVNVAQPLRDPSVELMDEVAAKPQVKVMG